MQLEACLTAAGLSAPLRVVMGPRLRAAREATGLNQADAGRRLGYTQGGHLCEAESGTRPMPLERAILAARLYGVTMDYLLGLADDPAPDPVAAVQGAVASRIAAEVHHLAQTMVEQTAALVRSYMPCVARGERLAGLALEAHAALQRLRERCPDFDKELPASALVARLPLAADVAAEYRNDTRRAREHQQVRDQHVLQALKAPLTLLAIPEPT